MFRSLVSEASVASIANIKSVLLKLQHVATQVPIGDEEKLFFLTTVSEVYKKYIDYKDILNILNQITAIGK